MQFISTKFFNKELNSAITPYRELLFIHFF